MTAGISFIPGKTGAHRAPLQLDSTAIREFLGILLLIAENTELCKILVASVQTARRNDLKSSRP